MGGDGADRRVADDVVEEICGSGGTALASYDSVDTPAGAQAMVELALSEYGRLDAVVSNAGIFHTAPFDELAADEWHRMLRVHLDGAFHVSQAAFRAMKAAEGGRFVFIASSAGMFGQPNSAHYAAAKAGTAGLANVIAIEGEPHGIRANCVLPFGKTRMATDNLSADELEATQGFLDAIQPELVVPLVTFLASRSCDVTHQIFSACAGRYARVFVGLAEGWLSADDSEPTAEDIAAHFDAIGATDPYTVPGSIFDEVGDIIARRDISL